MNLEYDIDMMIRKLEALKSNIKDFETLDQNNGIMKLLEYMVERYIDQCMDNEIDPDEGELIEFYFEPELDAVTPVYKWFKQINPEFVADLEKCYIRCK